MKVLILGAGKMVDGILSGLVGKVDMKEWSIFSPSGTSAQALATRVGAKAVVDLDQITHPDWILVGCKPQQLEQLKISLGNRFEDALFISMLAALSEADQMKILGCKSLIRVMPNLAVKYNQGISLLSSNSALAQLKRIEEIFHFLGEVVKVSEEELEELTLLTGSGPAFYYEFSKNLAASFTSLTPELREKLVRKVLAGAAVSASNDHSPLSELTSSVTSKAGVTIAVLEEWRKNNLNEFLNKGILAGKKRSGEIRAQMKKT